MQFIQGRGLDEVLDELRQIGQSTPPPAPAPSRFSQRADVPKSTVSAAEVARAVATGQFQPSLEFDDDSLVLGDNGSRKNGTEAGTGPAPRWSASIIKPVRQRADRIVRAVGGERFFRVREAARAL